MAGLDDIAEQKEWTDAIASVIAFEGSGRADDLLEEVVAVARRSGGRVPSRRTPPISTPFPLKPRRKPGRPRDRKAHPLRDPLERRGHRCEGQ